LNPVTFTNHQGTEIQLIGKYRTADVAILRHWWREFEEADEFDVVDGVPMPVTLIGDPSEVICYDAHGNGTPLQVRDFVVEVSTRTFKRTIDGNQFSLPGRFLARDFPMLRAWTEEFESIGDDPIRLLDIADGPDVLYVRSLKNRAYQTIEKIAVMEMLAHVRGLPIIIAHIRPGTFREGDRTFLASLTCTAAEDFQIQLVDFWNRQPQYTKTAVRVGPFSYAFTTHDIAPGRYCIMNSDKEIWVMTDLQSHAGSEDGPFTPVDPAVRKQRYMQISEKLSHRGSPSPEQNDAMCNRVSAESISILIDFSKPYGEHIVWRSLMFQRYYGTGDFPELQTDVETLSLCIARGERTFTDPVFVKAGDQVLKYNVIVRSDPSSALVMCTFVPFSDTFAATQLELPPSPESAPPDTKARGESKHI
jgi:hypothetical protein